MSRRRADRWRRTPPRSTRGTAITLADDRYPRRLARLPSAPPVLFVEGDPACLERPTVAVVGTRQCTAYGVGVTRHLCTALASAGVTIVSGLARGIDAHAHRAALAQGLTAAVLAHGLDHTAPPSNRRLRLQIVQGGGCMLTTWPDDFGPQRYTFPKRNQWIAGLAHAVVVVEAPARSGALYTANAAADFGRDVFVVPGPLGAAASRGCLGLIAEGAGVIADVDEFAAELAGRPAFHRADWLKCLFAGGSLDQVARLKGVSIVTLLADLAAMELKGEVVRLPGQRYAPLGSRT